MSADEKAPWPLPRNFLRPCILLLLREESAHGYDLLQRLRPLGFVRDDPGGLYRALRALEQDGLVRSSWDDSGSGPDRRVYRVTRAGLEELHQSAKSLANVREALDAFLDRTGEAGRTHR
jgi:PadR family transcriptional regulator PadR